MNERVFLALGSNVGDRKQHLNAVIRELGGHPQIEVLRISSWINSIAEARVPQRDYLNGAVEIATVLTPMELLEVTQGIERQLGRQSKGDYQPRTVDIDILFFGDQIICTEGLTIPHPMLHTRSFVLGPMSEIAPEMIHPLLQTAVGELAGDLHASG